MIFVKRSRELFFVAVLVCALGLLLSCGSASPPHDSELQNVADDQYLLRLTESEGEDSSYGFEVCLAGELPTHCVPAFVTEGGEKVHFEGGRIMDSQQDLLQAEELQREWTPYRERMVQLAATSGFLGSGVAAGTALSINAKNLIDWKKRDIKVAQELMKSLDLLPHPPEPIHFGAAGEDLHIFSDDLVKFAQERFSFSIDHYRISVAEIEKSGTDLGTVLAAYFKENPEEAYKKAIAPKYWVRFRDFTVLEHNLLSRTDGAMKEFSQRGTSLQFYYDSMHFMKQKGISKHMVKLLKAAGTSPLSGLKSTWLFAIGKPITKKLYLAAGITAAGSAMGYLWRASVDFPGEAVAQETASYNNHSLSFISTPLYIALLSPEPAPLQNVESVSQVLQGLGSFLSALEEKDQEQIFAYCLPQSSSKAKDFECVPLAS